MARSLGQFARLAARVDAALEHAAPDRARAVEAARRAFMRHELRARSGIFSARLAWAGGAAVAVFAAVLLFVTHRRVPLTFAVDGSEGVAKTWLAAPESVALHLEFSEGTKVRMEAASRARVVDIDAHGASLSLESGSVHAEVVHKAGAAWKVVAGPFTVSVTGTVFDVNWEPNAQQLIVSVSRGSVSVRDSSTGGEQPVRSQETLRATASEHRFAVQSAGEGEAPAAKAAAPAGLETADGPKSDQTTADPRDGASAVPDAGSKGTLVKSDSAASEWREFAKRGALREAFASAESAGFARTCALATPSELLMLGDGARLSGKPDRAIEALLSLRRRYPSDPRRAAAAFSLGKVAFDQRGAYEQAAEWFSTSLREQPGGPLAREASGRLIEALRRADDSAGARRAARDYLNKYPEGPHADLARSVLR